MRAELGGDLCGERGGREGGEGGGWEVENIDRGIVDSLGGAESAMLECDSRHFVGALVGG